MGAGIVRMSPRICDGNTVVKDALIPDPSLEVADRFRGAVLLLTIGHRFSKLKRLVSGFLVAGGPTSPKGIKPRSQLYTTKSFSWRLAPWSATSCKSYLKKNIYLN